MNSLLKERKHLFFDGAMGTLLYQHGLQRGEVPEIYNITHPELIKQIHVEYLRAGCDIITTNTFGANAYRLKNTQFNVQQIVYEAVFLAKEAVKEVGRGLVALNIGSTREQNLTDLYCIFKEQVIEGVQAGCDLVILEAFMSIKELEIAIRAVQENTVLPIICCMSFEKEGTTYLGATINDFVRLAEKKKIAGIGINCSQEPKDTYHLVNRLITLTKIPVIVNPNSGLPIFEEEKLIYSLSPEEFAQDMKKISDLGVSFLGGCCGTTPEHMQEMINLCR